jgi:cation transport regulator ChaC
VLFFGLHEAPTFASGVRQSANALWSPADLMGRQDKALAFYMIATINAVVSVLLPVFILGAFVFKLFRHDPLTWRKKISVEAHPSGFYVLAARFYNHFTVPAADVRVRAWLRWIPPDNLSVHRNKRLQLIVRGQHDDEPTWPLAVSAEPTTVRVLMCDTQQIPVSNEEITIQGERVPLESATIVLIADGITPTIGEQFRSLKTYSLGVDLDYELFQDITPGKPNSAEWKNFDGSQYSYVFVYGSLMRPVDLENAGIAPSEIMPAVLGGWRRCWNVASDPAAKNRVYHYPDGRAFEGRVASLGLTESRFSNTVGVLVHVNYKGLAAFDRREQDYIRTDVTRNFPQLPVNIRAPARIFTYVPRGEAVEAFARNKHEGRLAVVASYVESVREAARNVSDECLRDFNEAEGLSGLPVLELSRTDNAPESHA